MKRYGGLLRVLGVAFGWAVIVGNTIGAGILRAPGEVAQAVPSYPVFFLLWLVGGLYALLGALSLAELGAMIPKSGGQTVFVRRAFGSYPGFAVAWSDWLSTCASIAAVTIVLVDAVVVLAPALTNFQGALASVVILGFAAVQWSGIRSSGALQLATSALKAVAFASLIIACFLASPPAREAVTAPSAPLTLAGIVLAMQIMIFTYDGWTGVLYFSGEVREPGRDIPRSMVTGVVSVLIIYLLLNAAFLWLIPLNAMAGDQMVADTASRIVFGAGGTAIIRILIAISLLSTINASVLMGSRVVYATGATRVNSGGTPTVALAITIIASLAFLTSGTFNQVIAMAAFFFVANYAASFASVFRLRRLEPQTNRPYLAWGYPVTTAIVLLGSIAFLVAVMVSDRRHSLYAVGLLLLSYPVYRVLRKIVRDPDPESP